MSTTGPATGDPRVTVRVSTYTVSALDAYDDREGYLWDVTVRDCGAGRWGVFHSAHCLSRDGEWDYERAPEAGRDEWLDAHRFSEADAIDAARAVAPTIRVNGRSPEDINRRAAENTTS